MYTILNERVVVQVSGEDRLKYLQGLITNDINKLKFEQAIYACMLTPQGKYFADFFLTTDQDTILLDIPAVRKEEILKKLNIYKLRSLVKIVESEEYKVVVFINEHITSSNQSVIFADPRLANFVLRGFIHSADFKELTHGLEQNENAYDSLRVDNFVAEGEKDLIPEQSFLLEYGLGELNAIDYKKGCYVGQELVARTYYRGVVRKQIVQVYSSGILPERGTNIYINKQKIGIICSSVANRGLALIKTEEVIDLNPQIKITAADQEIQLKFKENIP